MLSLSPSSGTPRHRPGSVGRNQESPVMSVTPKGRRVRPWDQRPETRVRTATVAPAWLCAGGSTFHAILVSTQKHQSSHEGPGFLNTCANPLYNPLALKDLSKNS